MPDRDLARAAAHVQEILTAAEETAEQMRAQAEARMQSRISEGQRAADLRIQAAEAEALEILGAAQDEAEKVIDAARLQARDIVGEASASAREVLRDGSELSGHLRELSNSLRANSELLLRDVRLAHAEMTARLDQVSPAAAPQDDGLDVPEFHPGRR